MEAQEEPEVDEWLAEMEDGGIDAGLLLLELMLPRGIELSQADIAFVCGCSRGYIWLLEKTARQKLRRKFEQLGIRPAL